MVRLYKRDMFDGFPANGCEYRDGIVNPNDGTVEPQSAWTIVSSTLTFRSEDGVFVDVETGTTWNVLGDAVDGPLTGSTLEPITFVRTFWFSWAAFRPDTALIEN